MTDAPRIFVIHALEASLKPVARAFADGWPKAEVCNLMDDALSRDRRASPAAAQEFEGRFRALIEYALGSRADGILFACSAFNAIIDRARNGVSRPVLKPDEAMIERAFESGDRFAVVATFEPSIESLRSQIEAEAERRGRSVSVEGVFVDSAMDALGKGDGTRHDTLIAGAVGGISGVDVILLAQFSMARAADAAASRASALLLTSPRLAVSKLRALVAPAAAPAS